jgi:hypothetical protein
MMKKHVTYCIAPLAVLLLTGGLVAAAGAAEDGGVPGGYLRYGSSARSLALGNAVTGLADDAAVSYWNPAGYAALRTMELSAMGASLGMDTRYGFVTLGLPTASWGTFAVSGTYTTSGDFERTTVYEDLGETFSEDEGIFGLGWARRFGRLALGVNVKSVRQDIGGATGSGTGVDVGAYFRPHRAFAVGASIQNAIAPTITLVEDEEELPSSMRAGVALGFFEGRMQMTADAVKTRWMDTSFHGGLEAWPMRQIAVRAGYDGGKEQWAVGAGMRWQNWQYRALFSPSGADRSVTFGIRTAVGGEVDSWQVTIRDQAGREVTRLEGAGEPPAAVTWDGQDTDGRLVGDGIYQARVVVIDDLGQHWDYESDVEVLGFRERTRTPIRVEIGGGAVRSTAEGSQR